MVRNHSQHRDAADERARLAKLAQHENTIRQLERDRERRRILATLTVPEPVEDPDFPGCVW
jgi:transcription elongation GreA/GreB family factor